jgi:hypothetical protein
MSDKAMNMKDEFAFWRACCERGICVCVAPKPMKEEVQVWLVQKQETLSDRTAWKSAHTFDSLNDVFVHVGNYLASGTEPPPRNRRP